MFRSIKDISGSCKSLILNSLALVAFNKFLVIEDEGLHLDVVIFISADAALSQKIKKEVILCFLSS